MSYIFRSPKQSKSVESGKRAGHSIGQAAMIRIIEIVPNLSRAKCSSSIIMEYDTYIKFIRTDYLGELRANTVFQHFQIELPVKFCPMNRYGFPITLTKTYFCLDMKHPGKREYWSHSNNNNYH